MSYCGEVSEDDWCSFHACMRNMCRWQHEETFEQRERRLVAAHTRDEWYAMHDHGHGYGAHQHFPQNERHGSHEGIALVPFTPRAGTETPT
jgi:hypothetical protein